MFVSRKKLMAIETKIDNRLIHQQNGRGDEKV